MDVVVHICIEEKFVPPIVRLIKYQCTLEKHVFLVGGRKRTGGLDLGDVFRCHGWFSKLRWLPLLYRANKIILHGLYESQFLYLLMLHPWLLGKCYWIPWGGDLYQYANQREGLKAHFKEWVRSVVIRRIGHVVTYIRGDYDLIRLWYGSDAVFHECLCYESNTVVVRKRVSVVKGCTVIQVGNSAYARNNHFDAIDRIAKFSDCDIKVVAPLSYGPKEEALRVAAYGAERLGSKFVPMFEFMAMDDYLDYLDSVDIGIFNQDNQQAMGNMIALLGMGKTVYLRRSTTSWGVFVGLGIRVFDVDNLNMVLISPDDAVANVRIVRRYFSRENLVNQYRSLFGGKS